jgi:U32 family peptidase
MHTELLSPAGTLVNMRYAFAYGADAVYAGLPRYSLRVRNNDFDIANLKQGIGEAHLQGKKFYFTCNLLPHDKKVSSFINDISEVIDAAPDAMIMADPGLIMLVRERWPDMPIHLSVQANTLNSASVKFWHQLGVERIILSRELSLDEIEHIRQECPEMQLEVFVHGALCMAYSGRCLLSGYFNHRDPNQGSCTNSCRWQYKLHPANQEITGDITPDTNSSAILPSKEFLLEESGRPGEFMPISEDEHGTYIMNSKDLRAVEHVNALVKMGIDSLKIEGRTKSHYYTARTAQVYRQAIDDAHAGKDFDPNLLVSLENLASRGYTDGFYQRHQSDAMQNYISSYSSSSQQIVVGEIAAYDASTKLTTIKAKNKFSRGDKIEVISPSGNFNTQVTAMFDHDNQPVEVAKGSSYIVQIPLEREVSNYSFIARELDQQLIIKSKYTDATATDAADTDKKTRRPAW